MARLKAKDFLFATEEAAIAALEGPPPPERRVMWTILQYHFGEPWIHYELQPQVGRRRVEVGLHFESAAEQSERAAHHLAQEASWLLPSLGNEWELEEWTGSWRRLHRTIPFEVLNADTVTETADAFARLIDLTAPVLEAGGFLREPRTAEPGKGSGGRFKGKRRRRRS